MKALRGVLDKADEKVHGIAQKIGIQIFVSC